MDLSIDQQDAFHRDGFVIARGLLTAQEAALVEQIGRADQKLIKSGAMKDAQGGESKIWLAMGLGEDVYTALARNPRLVRPVEQFLGGPVYLWHYKMIMKEPRVGGAWEWHQDYGYWYHDGCLYPRLASCMVAINRATRENGCLQVLRGSHQMGRIDHGRVGGQAGADVERVAAASKVLDLVHVELEAGDAIFFHCNLLHRSAQNLSDHPRWAFISCYNAMSNIPYKGGHGKPVQLDTWDDQKFMTIAQKQLVEVRGTVNSVN